MAILDLFSLLWVYIGTVVLVMVAAKIGFQVGRWLQRRDPESGKVLLTGPVIGGFMFSWAICSGLCLVRSYSHMARWGCSSPCCNWQ